MTSKQAALIKIKSAWAELRRAKEQEKKEREYFAKICREAHEEGVSDQAVADITGGGYSRARIWQLRSGREK